LEVKSDAVNQAGFSFVDCDDSFCIDVDELERAITPRTRAIVPVHLTGDVAEMPREKRNTPRGTIELSTPEVTAFDLVGYPLRSGGLDNVATVLGELAEKLSPRALVKAARLSPVPWSQRLGHLLEQVQADKVAEPLADYVGKTAKDYVPLNPKHKTGRSERSARWRLLVNEKVEPDL